MAKIYVKYTRGQFEYGIREALKQHNLGILIDITEEWKKEGNVTEEHVYKIPTKNKAVDIIVFSSISINESKVRQIGGDAVRFVLRWKTQKGYRFKRIGKCYRTKGLFTNFLPHIKSVKEQVFNLKAWEFSLNANEAIKEAA